jgi:branched-chain amino acid aminotransferase
MPEPIAWLNGRLLPVSAAAVPVTDLGVVAGASITEMVRTFRGDPFRLDEHLDRFFASLDLVGFPTLPERCQLLDAVEAIVTHNSKLIPAGHDLGIIIFTTAGQNLTYLGEAGRSLATQGTTCVHSFPLPFELWAAKLESGQHLATVDVRPLDVASVPPQAKHRNRLHWYRADQQARARFATATALVTTAYGHITETSAGNILVVRGREILTPPSELVLGGVSRQVAQELAERLGFNWFEALQAIDDLLDADEILTSSTTYCLLPVTRLNDQPIGSGSPGPVFRELMAAWSDQVGVDIVQQAVNGARDRR